MPQTLAIDPGSVSGAVVLAESASVLAWGVWTRKDPITGALRFRDSDGEQATLLPYDLGQRLRGWMSARPRLLIEGLFAGGKAGSRRGAASIACAMAAGALWAPLSPLASEVIMPKARRDRSSEPFGWRAAVLGLPDDCPADRCEDIAIQRAPQLLRWGDPDPFARGARMLTLAELGALAEAGCMTLYP